MSTLCCIWPQADLSTEVGNGVLRHGLVTSIDCSVFGHGAD